MRSKVKSATAVALAIGLGGALGGCGSVKAAKTAGSDRGSTQSLSFFQNRVSQLFTGASFTAPEGGAPRPQPGKNIWAITYGLAASAGAEAANGAKEAGDAIGWNVKIFDGKFDPNLYLSGIRQAVAAKADGIVLYAIDCPTVQAALRDAKAAGVAVVAPESLDCNEVKAGAPSLFATTNGMYNAGPFGKGKLSYAPWIENWGAAQVDGIVAHTGGRAKIIDFFETDTQSTQHLELGARREVAKCPGCEIVATVKFTGNDFGPALQAKASQALLQHPEANAVIGSYDAPVTGGIAAAVRSSGRAGKLYVTGGEGDPPNVKLVLKGQGQNVGVADPVRWQSYAAIDALNRHFHGKGPGANGIGFMLWDKDHNVSGNDITVPVDFKAEYLKAWGVR